MYRKSIEKLKKWSNSKGRKPLIIKGSRQIGKTYLLHEFGRTNFPKYHYFNFEDQIDLAKIFERNLNPSRIIDELTFFSEHSSIDPKEDLIIFDEVQYSPRAITSLKYFAENMPELAICAAGSLLGLEFETYSFPVGKVDFLEMFPMSFHEFLLATGDQKSYDYLEAFNIDEEEYFSEPIHNHIWEQLKKYFIIGGLPEIVKIYADKQGSSKEVMEAIRSSQKKLLDSYLADIAKHSGKQNSMHIERLWQNIPQQLAKEDDGNAKKFKVRGQIPGIKGYAQLAGTIDWLQKARTVIKVPIANNAELPISAFTKENAFKLFNFDIGMLGAMSNLKVETIMAWDFGTYKGYFAENFVAQEIACAQESMDHIYSWKENTAEVEFLKEGPNHVIPVEVKSGHVTRAKSIKVFADKYEPPYRVILSAKNLNIDKEHRIRKYPLYLAYKLFS